MILLAFFAGLATGALLFVALPRWHTRTLSSLELAAATIWIGAEQLAEHLPSEDLAVGVELATAGLFPREEGACRLR